MITLCKWIEKNPTPPGQISLFFSSTPVTNTSILFNDIYCNVSDITCVTLADEKSPIFTLSVGQ